MKKIKQAVITLSVSACALGLMVMASPAGAMTLNIGTQSEHVLNLQERLSSLGYFKKGITGYYGKITKEAVRDFQKAYGLSVTGSADSATLAKLNQMVGSKQITLDQLARIIYAEARGESFKGQVAVGAVVLNRVQSNAFPDSITEVIFQPGQFSAIRDGQYSLKPNQAAYDAARSALNGWDPTGGALYYYNPHTATSSWSKSRPTLSSIGNHVFTR